MARLTSFINEKVTRKEIDVILKSDDVLVGAEFEFKMSDNMFNVEREEHEERVRMSLEYDEAFSEWKENIKVWRSDYDSAVEESREDAIEIVRKSTENEQDFLTREQENEVEDIVEEAMQEWMGNNPEPVEPEEPEGYIYSARYNRLDIDFDMIQNALDNYMSNTAGLEKYLPYNSDWERHEDCSLSGTGVELVSPPMPIKEFLEICPRIFEMINEIGFTDNECGLHIGVSLKNGMSDVDTVKLALFTDENYIWKKFSGRDTSEYVEKMQEKIRKEMYKGGSFSSSSSKRALRINDLKDMIRDNDIDLKYMSNHYHGVNIEHLDESNPYIEFRYLGGSGYHNKWPEVKTVVAQYIYNLKLARDPEFKKKEYLAKCTRILNKLETWAILKEIEKEERKKFTVDLDNEAQKEQELYIRKLVRRLQFLPKLSNNEKKFMNEIGA